MVAVESARADEHDVGAADQLRDVVEDVDVVVEAAFLFLWVESLREAGALAFWGMLVFLGILLLGWLVALRKGDLDWTRYR